MHKIIYYICMETTVKKLPTDLAESHKIILEQQEALDHQRKTIDEIRRQYENLQHQVQKLLRHQFDQKSEQGIPGQETLFGDSRLADAQEQADDDEIDIDAHKRKKTKRKQRQFPEHLERKRIEYDLTEAEKICGCGCGAVLKKIGEDKLEQLELIPAQLYVIEHIKFKYAGCKIEPMVVTAKMPAQPIEQSMAAPGLLADTIVKKYDDHLPLYRQSEIWDRQGIDIARSTLCEWLMQCAFLLKPIVMLMKKLLLQSPKVHTDDTIIPVLDPEKNKTKKGRLWIYLGGGKTAPPCAVYDYTPTRAQAGPMAFLQGYKGYLQADAYTGYDVLYDKQHPDFDIIEVACMAHCRRKFYEIAKATKKAGSAHQALAFIQKLYRIETEAETMSDQDRYQRRQEKAKPIIDEFKQWLDVKVDQVIPKSPLGQAIAYTLKNWEALTRYCDDGMLAIDNNAAERLMRVVAVGRKNYLFAGSDQGAENAAVFYSLIETCKLHKINPYHYLRDVLKRLPTQLNSKLDELLPWSWQPDEPLNPEL